MKVELDLSTEQLENLDKGLTDTLLNLNDEQKVTIIQTYLNEKFDNFYRTYTNSWGSTTREISEFGKELTNNLQNKIKEAVADKILEKEEVTNIIDENINKIEGDLQSIIKEAISKYIIDHLFSDQDKIRQNINEEIWHRQQEMANRHYN